MTRGQQQGTGTTTVAMVVFAALWLVSTVLLVFIYVDQEELVNDNARLKDDNAVLISQSERNSLQLLQSAHKEGPTVVGLLEGARADTAEAATGEPGDDVATVRSKLDELLRTIRSERIVSSPRRYEDVSYHDALSMLYEAFNSQHAQHQAASDRVGQLEAKVDQLVSANTELQNEFEKRVTELADQLAEAESGRAEMLRERDEALTRLEREFDQRRQQGDADLTEERQRVAALIQQLGELRKSFAAYQEKFGELMIGPEEHSTARRPDGRILTAIPGDQVVYIDLGRLHAIPLGLRFAVYSAETGIPVDGTPKAQIEVVSVSEDSAQCKIVRLYGHQPILPGDLIGNPVYDRNRPLSFLVVGVFDLNHDGAADSDGVAAIESMITDWGGTLSSELTALTDFVVLGGAPRRPRRERETSSEQSARYQAMKRAFDRYTETLATAKSLSVPILPQEVFLHFLGYAGGWIAP